VQETGPNFQDTGKIFSQPIFSGFEAERSGKYDPWPAEYDEPWTEELDNVDPKSIEALDILIAQLKKQLHGEKSDGKHKFFRYEEERRELFEYSKDVADYVHDNGIADLVIVDRSSRPMYIGVREYWKAKYPDEQMPGMYFLNPKGFKSIEETSASDAVNARLNSEYKEDRVEGIFDQRPEAEIMEELKGVYRALLEDKDKPVLVFDSCLHTGDTLKPVKDTMEEAGFTNLLIGAVNPSDYSAAVRTDYFITTKQPEKGCYPFDRDRMIEKTFDHVYSAPATDPDRRHKSAELRFEIRNIMTEQIEQARESGTL
jgi:hypothetical protein